MRLSDLDKIGTVEILTVRHHARRYYLPLRQDFITAFGLKKGDQLRVKIEGRVITPGGEKSGE